MPDASQPTLALGTVAIQLGIVLLLVLLNGFFVAAEFSLVSVRRTRIDQLAAEGSGAAKTVQHAVHNMDRYIAATQVGITVASLLLGGIGERTLEPLIVVFFQFIHWPENLLGLTRASIGFFLAYFVMTSMHVVIGELMPKSIALQKAEGTSMVIVRPMVFFAKLFAPLIWLLNGTGNFLLHIIGFHTADGHAQVHSAEELDLLFTQSHEGGQLTATERDLLHRVVKFSDLTAREVMVPRTEMKAIELHVSPKELCQYMLSTPHTRTPVYRSTLDDIIGIAHLKDMLFLLTMEGQKGAPPSLMKLSREALRVPETITIDKLLIEFQNNRQQMAIVIDEFGGTAGIITMDDINEQVVGEFHDEFDSSQPEIVETASGDIDLAGKVLIDEINERYGVGFDTEDADTMAGLVLNALGRPATLGDNVVVSGVALHVTGLDRLRITRLRIERTSLKIISR